MKVNKIFCSFYNNSPEEDDHFKIKVILDIDSQNRIYGSQLKSFLEKQINDYHKIGDYGIVPEKFEFRTANGKSNKTMASFCN